VRHNPEPAQDELKVHVAKGIGDLPNPTRSGLPTLPKTQAVSHAAFVAHLASGSPPRR
jgi:hypothetical protein